MANAATQQGKAPQQKPLRKDPARRHVTTAEKWLELENKDPDLHYVWVNKNGGIGADPSFYRAMGYRVVKYEPGGVVPMGRGEEYQAGQPLEFLDCVLMACPLELKQEYEHEGQEIVDKTESQIIDKERSPRDLLRGIPGGFFARHGNVINETESLFRE